MKKKHLKKRIRKLEKKLKKAEAKVAETKANRPRGRWCCLNCGAMVAKDSVTKASVRRGESLWSQHAGHCKRCDSRQPVELSRVMM